MVYREPGGLALVVAATNSHVHGLHAETGAEVWRFEFPEQRSGFDVAVRLAMAGEFLYALTRGWLACIHLPTGRAVGQVRTRGALGPTPGSLLAAPDRILVAQGGVLQCFSPQGRLLWERRGLEFSDNVALAYGDEIVQGDRGGS
jgi:hypothetical protein